MAAFRNDLPAVRVDRELKSALRALKSAERNAVLWFSEILARKLYRELGYSSVHQYASEELGFSRSKTYQFLRLSESFAKLPELKESVAKGEIPWTKAREVARVATPRTEDRWIQEARTSSRRELERRIDTARKRAARARRENPGQGVLAGAMDGGSELNEGPAEPPRSERNPSLLWIHSLVLSRRIP